MTALRNRRVAAFDTAILAADGLDGERQAPRGDLTAGGIVHTLGGMSVPLERPDLGFRWLDREEIAGETRFSVEVPPESPAFRGHFPGRPILPAVAQLALVEQGLALESTAVAGSPSIAQISGLRLRRTVGPGDRLSLFLGAPTTSGGRRFEIRDEGGIVSGGTLRSVWEAQDEPDETSPPRRGAPGDGAAAVELEILPEPILALGRVPHAPPALLVESLLARGPAGARACGLVPAVSAFAVGAVAPSYLGLEIAAQAAALVEALGRERGKGGPRVGYLVAIRQARCYARTLPVGVPLDVFVLPAGSAPPLSIYEIRVEREGRLLVSGTISTWIAEGEA